MNKFEENAGLDMYEDSNKEKERKVLKYFKEFFEIEDIDVVLRVHDSRVNHYSVYMEITKEVKEKIMKEYSCKVNKNIIGRIDNIETIGKVSFTIYNCKGKKKKELIEKHNKEFESKKY